jgi:hypothetical protein
MVTWKEFQKAEPELAAFGVKRLHGRVTYLATVRNDGSPRVYPVTPIIGRGRMFLFMEPTSPKGHDLRRDGRYALHCAVEDTSGRLGEFFVHGRGLPVHDPAIRAIAIESASYKPADRYVLFELTIESASSTLYKDGKPKRMRWQSNTT